MCRGAEGGRVAALPLTADGLSRAGQGRAGQAGTRRRICVGSARLYFACRRKMHTGKEKKPKILGKPHLETTGKNYYYYYY